ncbi:MAG: hypothetical protein QGH15_12195 [Kiritimatiellia bacterium]|jgi:hypothetical protein|nr:hypothetical protein [Kiritimatiellia bacterium]
MHSSQIILYLFPTCLVLFGAAGESFGDSSTVVSNSVRLSHPAIEGKKPIDYTLYRNRNADAMKDGYFMDVDSVICEDGQCAFLTGSMHWDLIGRYRRYSLEPGKDLTKEKHHRFAPEDYIQLDRLLRNRDSLLRDHPFKDLTKPGKKQDIHGITGATAEALKAETVPGAVHTCYTLWHWANGDVIKTIRELTAASLDTALACRLLEQGDEKMIIFTVEALESRGIYDLEAVNAVKQALATAKGDTLTLCLRYLKSAIKDTALFYSDAAALFGRLNQRGRYTILGFLESQPDLPAAFLGTLINLVPSATEYYEVHRILALVERHQYSSDGTNGKVAELLTSDSFFIARRALWFLEKRELKEEEKEKIKAFRQRYGDRL